MAIALVAGQNATTDFPTGATSRNVVLTNNPTTGNLVVVLFTSGFSTLIAGLAAKDSSNNSYVLTSKSPFLANVQNAAILYLKNAPANATKTITVSWTSGTGVAGDIWALEFSGVDTVSPFENDATGSPASASTYTTPSYTTLNDGDLLVSAAGSGGTISGVGTPFTAATGIPTAQGEGGEYFIQTTHGAQAVAYTLSVNGSGAVIIAAFKAASGDTLGGAHMRGLMM